MEGIDLLAVMMDASQGLTRADREAFQRTERYSCPVYLLLNKIDLIPVSAFASAAGNLRAGKRLRGDDSHLRPLRQRS